MEVSSLFSDMLRKTSLISHDGQPTPFISFLPPGGESNSQEMTECFGCDDIDFNTAVKVCFLQLSNSLEDATSRFDAFTRWQQRH